jgi:DNA-binding transcriptional LysR family regulator
MNELRPHVPFDLDGGELRSFVVLAEQKHFGRAAKLLGISQPALSKRQRRLEDKVGGPLLLREYRDVRLTAAGQAFVDHARRLLLQADRALAAAQAAAQGTAGLLRIGYGVSSIAHLLPEVLLRFARSHPGVQIDMRDMSSPAQRLALLQDEIDLGFIRAAPGLTPAAVDDSIDAVPILRERLVAAVGAGSAWRQSLGLASLRDQPFVSQARGVSSSYHNHVLALCHLAGFTPRVVAESNELYSLLQLVRAGVGVALVPATCAAMRVPRVAFKPLRQPEAAWTINLSRRRAPPATTPMLDAFIRTAREVAKEQAARSS